MNDFYKIAKEGLESLNNSFEPLRKQVEDIVNIIAEIIENNYEEIAERLKENDKSIQRK